MQAKTILVAAALSVSTGILMAQTSFNVAGRSVQVHGFVSQGFAFSDQNNYLTMKTSEGSLAFTDFGFNISTQISDKFRVGAQVTDRNVGRLGDWRPNLDWAMADYRFKDWFGVRAGKVKTVLGLYNDTQDMDFLHTWAILPQSMYPLDLRSSTIAHTGVDVYGEISLKKLGNIGYTAYGGTRSDDRHGGIVYTLSAVGFETTKPVTGHMAGGDLRWNTPLSGLLVGASFNSLDMSGSASSRRRGYNLPIDFYTRSNNTNAFYADYTKGNLHLSGEYRRNWSVYGYRAAFPLPDGQGDQRMWYASGAYRVAKRLELGSYYSSYIADSRVTASSQYNHIYDTALTVRVDVTRHWNVKLEGHHMDGSGAITSPHGFYLSDNTGGLKPKTNLVVLRTGWNF